MIHVHVYVSLTLASLFLPHYDSYAPFCKHLFVKNFTDTRNNLVPITQANARLLLSDYEARAAGELPVYVSQLHLAASNRAQTNNH